MFLFTVVWHVLLLLLPTIVFFNLNCCVWKWLCCLVNVFCLCCGINVLWLKVFRIEYWTVYDILNGNLLLIITVVCEIIVVVRTYCWNSIKKYFSGRGSNQQPSFARFALPLRHRACCSYPTRLLNLLSRKMKGLLFNPGCRGRLLFILSLQNRVLSTRPL